MKKKFGSFEKLALGAVLSKNEQKNIFGGNYGPGGGGGGGGGSTFTLWCWKNQTSMGPITGGGCPSWSSATSICVANYGSGTIVSNLYC